MSGLSREYDAAAIASTYDPALHEAPIVVGHPTHDAPAFGWIASLSADGAELFGEPKQVDATFAEAVEAGRFKKISASFYLEDSPQHPVRVAGGEPTAPYLRHVGFLGALPPAVKGLGPVEFAEDEEGVATVEFSEADFADAPTWAVRNLARMFRRVRDYLAGRDGDEVAEQVIPSAEIDYTLEALAIEEGREIERERASTAAPSPAFSEPTLSHSPPDSPMADQPTAEDLAAREAQFAERERHLAARVATLQAQEADAVRRSHADFAESLAGDGARILPVHVPVVTAVLNQLAGVAEAGATVEFGEGDGAEQLEPAEALRRMLSQLPEHVDFAERSAPSGDGADVPVTVEFAAAPGFDTDVEQLAIHNKAIAYQAAHPGTDYVAAVRAVS